MGINFWKDDAEVVCVIRNMQSVAQDQSLWNAYMSCGDKGREVFKQCLADEFHDWSLNTVLVWANEVDTPSTPTPTPTPTVSTIVPTPSVTVRGMGKPECTNASSFINWMTEQTGVVTKNKGFTYLYGKRRVLEGDGTVAVSVSIACNGTLINGTGFVFHYHPGAKGATVGSTEGSKWHFKPFDGAKKHVRADDSQFCKLDQVMVKRVKDIARNKK